MRNLNVCHHFFKNYIIFLSLSICLSVSLSLFLSLSLSLSLTVKACAGPASLLRLIDNRIMVHLCITDSPDNVPQFLSRELFPSHRLLPLRDLRAQFSPLFIHSGGEEIICIIYEKSSSDRIDPDLHLLS